MIRNRSLETSALTSTKLQLCGLLIHCNEHYLANPGFRSLRGR
jgi:hypothetical protein